MAIYTVQQGETITDVVLNATGDISNWDAVLSANNFADWVPVLTTGQQVIIPDTISKNLNNVRQFSQYPLNNASVPDVYSQIDTIFNLMVTVTTTAPASVTSSTATSGGVITVGGGATIIARGVCWATTHNPTVSDSCTADGSGDGTFTSDITGLTAATTYYVRAYAQTSTGVVYGDEVSLTTAATGVILTTISGSNYTANKSTTDNIVYILSVQNLSTSPYTVTAISLGLYGSDVGNDVSTSGLKIYTNTTPDLSGSPSLKRSATVSGTFAFITTLTAFSITLPGSQTTYLIFSLDIASGATTGNHLLMSASDSPIGLTITGTPPQTDNQSDVSPVITVGT